MSASVLQGRTVVVDCRWLGNGGPGRATELLLRGLGELEPPGRWLLWGGRETERYAWKGAEWRPVSGSPKRWWGQRDALRLPRSNVAIYPHQIRPMRGGRSIDLIHDTIPLRQGGDAARLAKRLYLRAIARLSSRIVTVSDHSRRSIERDLGVSATRIRVVHYPVDREMADRVQALRERLPPEDVGLFVGRFAPHKNLDRLVTAFGQTRFRKLGGRLRLVGGTPSEVRELDAIVRARGLDRISVEGSLPQAFLEELYATSRFLVMPSLEEGFGLPAWEASTCGLRVCISHGGALPEILGDVARSFAPTSVSEMAAAMDETAEDRTPPSAPRGPTVSEFAGSFVEEAERVLAGPR